MVLKRGNRNFSTNPPSLYRAEVVAQLVEQALLTPEVRGSKPVIGKIYIVRSLSTVSKKTKIKKKMQGMAHFYINPHSHSLYLSLSLSLSLNFVLWQLQNFRTKGKRRSFVQKASMCHHTKRGKKKSCECVEHEEH